MQSGFKLSRARAVGAALATAAACAMLAVSAGPAAAASATADLTAGTLDWVTTPPNVTFTTALTGADQVATAPQALDVKDATGSGVGWKITATSTTFTAGANTLPDTATTIPAPAPTPVCDAGSSCTLATTNVAYPYTLPAGTVAPTATTLFNATASTGMGRQTLTPTWNLAIPGSTLAGTYTSTWTISLVSTP